MLFCSLMPRIRVGEERCYLLGLSSRLRLLVVIHAFRTAEGIVRLISARKATPSERAHYDARWT